MRISDPGSGHAVGLSFSVAPEVRPVPGSLINIYREYGQDLGYPPPGNGDLTPWTGQGVLLLNRALTTAPGKPAAHRDKTSGGGHSRPFSRANELLAQQGAQPVDWRLQ